jgi:hypothetical protein
MIPLWIPSFIRTSHFDLRTSIALLPAILDRAFKGEL